MHTAKISSVGILAACIGTQALAQAGQLEEVVVTATKRAESLQDVPVSVSALSESTIQEAGVEDIADVAALVPSLTVASNINPFATAIRIRGFGTAQNDPSLEASVAFILDGVYMGSSGLAMSDLTDIERIEVLQGPQGTLYGKNSNAGVVSVITKSPNMEESEGFLDASAGNYSLQRYTGSFTGPISDTVGYLISGSWNESDGWMESNTGDDLNNTKDWNLRGKLLWEPSSELSVQLTAGRVDRSTSCCAADATQTAAVTDELVAQGLPVLANDAFDYKNNVNIDSDFDLNSDAVNLTLEYELANATLTSLTAWADYDYETSYDADRSDLAVVRIVGDEYSGEQWSQELRLTSDLGGPLQYMLGLFYAYEERTRGGSDRAVVVVGEDMITVGGAQTGLGQLFGLGAQPGDYVSFDNRWETETLALFGQSSYDLSEAWTLTLGLRYTTETKDADLDTQPVSDAVLFGTGETFVEQAYAPIDESFTEDFNGFTWLTSLSYFVAEDTMVFGSVSTGTKSGGFNGVTSEGASPEFDDENTINYELGIKSQLYDNRLQLNATAFYTEFDDLQFLAQQPNGVGFFVSNAARGTSKGVDVSFSAVPWEFLSLTGGIQYLDADYTDGELEEAGLALPHAPEWSGNLAATLQFPLWSGWTYLRADYSYMGDHFNNPTYQPDELEQDKKLLNARLGWRDEAWDAAFWVKNATDIEYSSIAAAPLQFAGTEALFLDAPRTYGVTLRYTFGP